ncbi:hypothetical protein LUZ60_012905 [Juncus effusus]|nr:hypothetical protein LUZ60_012905 [Juncus effusus]
MSRPNRSDAHLGPEEEARIEAETREFFDERAPKRHTKPSRSEHSFVYSDALVPSDKDSMPELDKFQNLEAHSEKLVFDGNKAADEYVETEYYDDLNKMGEQHHTTGSGFIKMEKSNVNSFELAQNVDTCDHCTSCKGNPATNEWIPSAETVEWESNKPKRSN